MHILSVENVTKSFSEKELFNNISFGIDSNDKIGLVGVNGTGKSTLLKIISGLETPDNGQVTIGKDVTVEYMPQNPYFDKNNTVLEEIFKNSNPKIQLLKEYRTTLNKIESYPQDNSLQNKLIELNEKMDEFDAWEIENEAKTILNKLGITDFNAQINTLSGGQKKRVALAGALLSPSDLLILDEPTNHLDDQTVSWLEYYLKKHNSALLLVTHDRYFLDRVVNRIIEIDKGNIYNYPGHYSYYVNSKLEREEKLQEYEEKRKKLLKNELQWIKKGVKARGTKQKARIKRFNELQEEQVDLSSDKLEINVGASRLGKKIIELKNISKSFPEKNLIQNFSYKILYNDRVGIVGPNGIGKTTLLKLIAGKLTPDSGIVDIGKTVKIGSFLQENYEIDDNLRVIEYITEEGEYIPTSDGEKISASQMLERFLFDKKMQWSHISKLSGGEKRRLYLLRVLMSAPNVLLLDEPTNDLDIQTLTVLEDYLDSFPGAVIASSHDRYFLDRTADKILAFEGKGTITKYTGNYSDYKNHINEAPSKTKKESKDKKNGSENKNKSKQSKLSFKEKKEFEEIEDTINKLENELQEIENQINEAGNDYQLLNDLTQKQQELQKELDEKLERWAYLSELAEKEEY